MRGAAQRAWENAWIESIKVNAVTREIHDGRTFCIKRRRLFAIPVLAAANIFFRMCGAPVRTILSAAEWQRWEIESFQRLHGDVARCFASGTCGFASEELAGINLTGPLESGTLTDVMLRASGVELRRAHGTPSAFFDGAAWSHGDPHLGNFVFDATTSRARIIDFELRHMRTVPVEERHLDDLLGVLLDLIGRGPSSRWLSAARAFLDAYECPPLTTRAIAQLASPRGSAGLWWSIRTSWLPQKEARQRISELRKGLGVV
jgi:hypothetical protein